MVELTRQFISGKKKMASHLKIAAFNSNHFISFVSFWLQTSKYFCTEACRTSEHLAEGLNGGLWVSVVS
jgi:hypothetical protein